MKRFDYLRPKSLDEAVEAGARPGAAFLAGGTNQLDLMKTGASRPTLVVDVTRLPGLDGVERLPDGSWRIGALVRNGDLAADAAFRAAFPAIAEALLSGASGQLRNMATVGGNIAQHTRCPYFFDPSSPCNRREPGQGCSALGGETRNFAVLGWTDACIATHPSDFAVPLVALGAMVELRGPGGAREVPLADFHALPDGEVVRETVLAPGELVVALLLPADASAFAAHQRYLKLRDRTSFAFALVSAAAALRVEDGVIVDARLALGGVAARPWRSTAAEAVLRGAPPSPAVFRQAGEAALAEARPCGDNGFKVELARRVVARALALAARGAPRDLPALPASVFAPGSGAALHA